MSQYRGILLASAMLLSSACLHAEEESSDDNLSLESLESAGSMDSLREELKQNPDAAAGVEEEKSGGSDEEYGVFASPEEETSAPQLEWAKKSDDGQEDTLEEVDEDYGDTASKDKESEKAPTQIVPEKKAKVADGTEGGTDVAVFEVGPEEQELLDVAQTVGQQISNEEWREITQNSNTTTYTVQKNDWLFKISKKLFGTGFYYPKIWALNPYITNPHLIEPGMVLTFETGSGESTPSISVAKGESDEEHPWNKEKEELAKQGIYINSSSDEEQAYVPNNEYKKYDPTPLDTSSLVPSGQYDEFGIDKNSSYITNFKQGYFLNTFITTNQIQDFGLIDAKIVEGSFFTLKEIVYVKFNEGQSAKAGDRFSVYRHEGRVEVKGSDRSGDRYTILASLKLLRPLEDKWEAMVTEVTQTGVRGDRLTAYTPKIQKVYQTFNTKKVEAMILQAFDADMTFANIGSVVYLDRGRADGLEIGNVLDVYDNRDRSTGKVITEKETYRTGQLNIISITDNFSTALVTKINQYFKVGDIAITRTPEDEARDKNAQRLASTSGKTNLGSYDVKGLGDNLVVQSKSVKLTESELEELDREAHRKRILDDTEKDLKDLDALEAELASAEQTLDESELVEGDEDLDPEAYEKGSKDKNFGANLEAIEKSYGKKYLDEDLNQVDNPYGVTQYDVEEVDELLNLTDADFNNTQESDSLSSSSSAPRRKK